MTEEQITQAELTILNTSKDVLHNALHEANIGHRHQGDRDNLIIDPITDNSLAEAIQKYRESRR